MAKATLNTIGLFLACVAVGSVACREKVVLFSSPAEPPTKVFKLPQGEVYYPFENHEVTRTFHLDRKDLEELQVFVYGDLNLVSVSVSRDKRAGRVVDGKAVAEEEEMTTVQPFTIPHMTPGVIVSGNVVDFGGVEVDFSESRHFIFEKEETGRQPKDSLTVEDYGLSLLVADGRPLHTVACVGDTRIRVRANGQTYECERRNKSDRYAPNFLVFRGGDKFITKSIDTKEELRARGRVVK